MSPARSKWAVLAVLFVTLVVADQWTKFLAVERLTTVFARSGDAGALEKLSGFYRYRHLEPLGHHLACEVDVGSVFENHGDL